MILEKKYYSTYNLNIIKMKKRILLILSVVIISVVAMTNFNFIQSDHSIHVSLAEISVMAKADLESGGGGCESACPNPGAGCFYRVKDSGDAWTFCPDRHS